MSSAVLLAHGRSVPLGRVKIYLQRSPTAANLLKLCNRAYWTLHAIYDNQLAVGFRIGFISLVLFFFFCWWHWLVSGLFVWNVSFSSRGWKVLMNAVVQRGAGLTGWWDGGIKREQCGVLFRSQHKGSMVINVDMCFVFDSLGSSFHTHTMENYVFMSFLRSVCLASVDFCAVHLTYDVTDLICLFIFYTK